MQENPPPEHRPITSAELSETLRTVIPGIVREHTNGQGGLKSWLGLIALAGGIIGSIWAILSYEFVSQVDAASAESHRAKLQHERDIEIIKAIDTKIEKHEEEPHRDTVDLVHKLDKKIDAIGIRNNAGDIIRRINRESGP